jgi:hypothetical protein
VPELVPDGSDIRWISEPAGKITIPSCVPILGFPLYLYQYNWQLFYLVHFKKMNYDIAENNALGVEEDGSNYSYYYSCPYNLKILPSFKTLFVYPRDYIIQLK